MLGSKYSHVSKRDPWKSVGLTIVLITVAEEGLMMTSSNGNIFRVTGHFCEELIGPRWIPRTKASDAELWCFLWSALWINGWGNNREAGDLRRHRAHCDVIGMLASAGTMMKNIVSIHIYIYIYIYTGAATLVVGITVVRLGAKPLLNQMIPYCQPELGINFSAFSKYTKIQAFSFVESAFDNDDWHERNQPYHFSSRFIIYSMVAN